MLLLVLRAKQMQAGANWDSVVSISVGILFFVALALMLALIVSRITQGLRVRRAHNRARRRH